MSDTLESKLGAIFKDIRTDADGEGRLTAVATPESVLPVLAFLREAGYDHLQLVSCVDWIESVEMEVVYVLTAYPGGPVETEFASVILKTRVPRDAPSLRTSIGVFPVAEPYEREVHELFGVHFEGHPRLVPLFLEREYDIPPFRKDFDTRQYVEDVFGAVAPIAGESQKP